MLIIAPQKPAIPAETNETIAKLNTAARTAVESDAVKQRFADLSTVAPDANEHAPEVLQQLVTRDVAKYHKLLQ